MSIKKRVVVVDDKSHHLRYLCHLVEVVGGEVVGRGNGYEEGVALITEYQPDLLVTDLLVTDLFFDKESMSGSDLANEVSIPVVLVSTKMSSAVKRGMEYNRPHVTALDKDDGEAIIAAIKQALGA